MKIRKFKGEVLAGHKQDAVEVPFDPAEVWSAEPQPLWRGRRGHRVKGSVNGETFQSFIVPRQNKHYLLIDRELEGRIGIEEGDTVGITIELEG